MKATFSRILGINLALTLGTAVVLRIHHENPQNRFVVLGFTIGLAYTIVAQFFLNGLLGLIACSEATKQNFWMAALVTLLIGFGACVGGASIY